MRSFILDLTFINCINHLFRRYTLTLEKHLKYASHPQEAEGRRLLRTGGQGGLCSDSKPVWASPGPVSKKHDDDGGGDYTYVHTQYGHTFTYLHDHELPLYLQCQRSPTAF